MEYKSFNILQSTRLSPPKELDYVEFHFEGITIRAYGILHGVTGAHNRQYYDMITTTINNASGLRVGEKGMKLIYKQCNFDYEIDDWLVLRPSDSFFMGLQLTLDPRCLWMMVIDPLREKFTTKDPFSPGTENTTRANINESRYFHCLNPVERRTMNGHVSSADAIQNDLQILSSNWFTNIFPKKRKLQLYHPIYRRMMLLERFMHIPARSLHMLYYSLGLAKKSNTKLVSIFIGETHNTDMAFLALEQKYFFESLGEKEKKMFKKIKQRAERLSKREKKSVKLTYALLKIRYYLTLFLGACLPILLYIFIAMSM